MKVVRGWLFICAVVLLGGVAACGASSSTTGNAPAAAVIATSTTKTGGSLPFTDTSAADGKFERRLRARCRAIALPLGRLAQPATLSDQARSSDGERRLLMRLRADVTPLRPPADLARLMRSYRRALLSAIDSDGLVAGAATAGNPEGVAYWLSQRGAAMTAMKNSTGLLDAPACLP